MGELLQKQVDKLEGRVGKLEVLESSSTGVTTATLPLAITGTNIAIAITPANPGGAVALQAATPGTQQTGNENISGTILAATMTASGTVQGATVTSTGAVNGASEAITGASTAASYTATGTAQAATVNATSKVQLNGVTVLENGTSFPGSPSTNQRYFRTDRGLEYYYDGTRWLTVQLIPINLATRQDNTLVSNALTTTRNSVLYSTHPDNTSDIYITNIVTNLFVNGVNSAVNYWTISFITRDITGATTNTYSADTKLATTASRFFPITIAVNAVVTKANLYDILANYTITGTPGSLGFTPATVWCRLVG